MDQITASLAEAHHALQAVSVTDAAVSTSGDAALLDAVASAAALRRDVDALQSRLASEVAHRSRPELGHSGLAARRGAANAVALLTSLSRSSRADAAQLIRVGDLLVETTAPTDPVGDDAETGSAGTRDQAPGPDASGAVWGPLAEAVLEGRLGIEGADRVTRTLLPVVDQVDPDLLRDAVTILGVEAGTRNADDLTTMARGVRDTLDRAGVTDREQYLRAQRGLKRGRVIDGLRRVTMVLDPETDAIIIGAIDHAMSPRLGGPRITDPDDLDRATRLIDDDRSNEQIALDTLTDLIRIGVDRDDGTILGTTKPGLRVTIPLADLMTGIDRLGVEDRVNDGARVARLGSLEGSAQPGPAWLEGSPEPVSAATAQRILCDAGVLPIVLGGDSLPLEVGQTRRLFTTAQRTAMAIRDGGCTFGNCDRHGPTNLDNGTSSYRTRVS